MQRETVETGWFAARLKTGAGCARCESMQSPSSVTGFYDDYPATKCDYRTESAARDGWYVSVTSMTRWAHAVSVYRSVHGQHRNNSLRRTSNVPLHFIAFALVHVRGRVCVCVCVRACLCRSLKSAARLPTLNSLPATSIDDCHDEVGILRGCFYNRNFPSTFPIISRNTLQNY